MSCLPIHELHAIQIALTDNVHFSTSRPSAHSSPLPIALTVSYLLIDPYYRKECHIPGHDVVLHLQQGRSGSNGKLGESISVAVAAVVADRT